MAGAARLKSPPPVRSPNLCPALHKKVFARGYPTKAGLLGGVCCLISVLLIVGNSKTSVIIEEQVNQDKLAMMADVLPSNLYDNNPIKKHHHQRQPHHEQPITVMKASKSGQLSGAVLQVTIQGWGGKIQLIMGVNAQGEINGVRIVSHKETPGLADKIEVEKANGLKF